MEKTNKPLREHYEDCNGQLAVFNYIDDLEKYIDEIVKLNMHIVSRQFKDKESKTFIEWYLSEGYIPTERTGVYKNGCNIILGEDLYLKYTEAIKVKP